MFDRFTEFPIVPLVFPQTIKHGVELSLLRLDLTDEYVSGNKWFKLKYNLDNAITQKRSAVLSFGGAYSNHIHALAWAGRKLGIRTIGIIRGEPEYASNPTLSDAQKWGMTLHFVSRVEYRKRFQSDFLEELKCKFNDPLIIPEGGSNALAVKGAAEIVSQSMVQEHGFSEIVLACGTGGTLAGVAASQPELSILGIPVLKGAEFLVADIKSHIESAGYLDAGNWSLDYEGHFGGYGKQSPALLSFISDMKERHGVSLDQVYTGKMLMRLLQLIENGRFNRGSKVLAIHTGGLQGVRSIYTP